MPFSAVVFLKRGRRKAVFSIRVRSRWAPRSCRGPGGHQASETSPLHAWPQRAIRPCCTCGTLCTALPRTLLYLVTRMWPFEPMMLSSAAPPHKLPTMHQHCPLSVPASIYPVTYSYVHKPDQHTHIAALRYLGGLNGRTRHPFIPSPITVRVAASDDITSATHLSRHVIGSYAIQWLGNWACKPGVVGLLTQVRHCHCNLEHSA